MTPLVCGDTTPENKNYRRHLSSQLMKNITDVNKALQELIKNYKYLEKMYRTEETIQSDSTESEIDEVFRQMKNNKKNIKQRKKLQKNRTNTISPSTYYQGTAYIYESQPSGEKKESGDSNNIEEELGNDQNEEIKTEKPSSNKIKSGSENISGSKEIEQKSDEEEIDIEMPKKIVNIVSKPKKLQTESQKTENFFNKKKRFNVLYSSKDNIHGRNNKSDRHLIMTNQRIVYSELFSPQTIWHEIINRPIKLNRVMPSDATELIKNNNDRNMVIVVTNNTKDRTNLKDFENTNSNQLSNNDTEANSPVRSGYGDACLEIPIKKCIKSLKVINKKVCKSRFKCKSDFKSDFIENSKKGCQREYLYVHEQSQEHIKTTMATGEYFSEEVENQNVIREKKSNIDLFDVKKYRRGHLHLSTIKPLLLQKTSIHRLSLRDKYEKRCKKELRAKCIGAGNYVINKTCSKHNCEKKKLKALTKACKEECKKNFIIDKKTASSSGSDTDTDSESYY